jgi:hypothetical protein
MNIISSSFLTCFFFLLLSIIFSAVALASRGMSVGLSSRGSIALSWI